MVSSIEERALALLGSGVRQEEVAAALGVTSGRISQLLSDSVFAEEVAKLRYDAVKSHSVRDAKYDTIEDRLLDKLEKSIPLLIKPVDILKAISTINGAKRRGLDSTAAAPAVSNIVNLILPNQIVEKFSVNIDNQVIKAGDQELQTLSSHKLSTLLKGESHVPVQTNSLTNQS